MLSSNEIEGTSEDPKVASRRKRLENAFVGDYLLYLNDVSFQTLLDYTNYPGILSALLLEDITSFPTQVNETAHALGLNDPTALTQEQLISSLAEGPFPLRVAHSEEELLDEIALSMGKRPASLEEATWATYTPGVEDPFREDMRRYTSRNLLNIVKAGKGDPDIKYTFMTVRTFAIPGEGPLYTLSYVPAADQKKALEEFTWLAYAHHESRIPIETIKERIQIGNPPQLPDAPKG